MQTRTRKPTHPGRIIEHHYRRPLNLTVTALAGHLGISRKHLSNLINEKVGITSDMAMRLSRALGTSPDLWMNMQKTRDLWEAEHERTGWEEVKPLPGVQGVGGVNAVAD
ncbi:addiction module antidote protein, HigA family [Desulfomicrobium apsheronum]|uniref:Addiction module antidote protein, HigA family n=1 Tax=Desulfomicrobium apsheronum TaxID=52560 RepID=A0A1I3YI19_9BACT|nr:HigA family addiction module antitoxin [Desulfomicrobium apsheronum]SFK31430.1 addiction module antidote protein, HigA family [Desulfomicrobium apsheronum]